MNIIRKIGRFGINLNRMLWQCTPPSLIKSRFGLIWGRFIFRLVELRGGRSQLNTTYFYRNRPEMNLIRDLIAQEDKNRALSITIIGCSEGAEVFTILHSLEKVTALSRININAFDINEIVISKAKEAFYQNNSKLLSYLSNSEINELFDKEADGFRIKKKYLDITKWYLSDPSCEPILSSLPKQDVVVANRLLFHMPKHVQKKTLQAIATLVKSGGLLFVSGVDLDTRTRIAQTSGWQAIIKLIEEIHSSDESMTHAWPFEYWGLEPIDKSRNDWKIRYCSVFRMP